MPKQTNRKRLFLDIETSPNVGLFWRPGRKLTINPEAIVQERGVICACWKWQGEDKVHAATWDLAKDDSRVIRKLASLIAQADEVVAHNGDQFDIKWLRGRALYHGIAMPPRIVSQDTYKLAASLFNLNSHTLSYLGSYLGLGSKMATGGFDLWKRVTLDNDAKSLDRMVRYCQQDVVLLERVWDKLVPYTVPKSHLTGKISECPECGSKNLQRRGTSVTAAGHKRTRLHCQDCGKWHQVATSRLNNGR